MTYFSLIIWLFILTRGYICYRCVTNILTYSCVICTITIENVTKYTLLRMNTLAFLQNLGLSATEITLYELLLEIGESPAADIVRGSHMKRPTVYKALYSLQKKKLVTTRDINKKIHFRPAPPTELMKQTDERYHALQYVKDSLQAVLPHLNSSYIQSVERPIVREYAGEKGIKEVFEDIYSPKDDVVYGCVDLEISDEAVPTYVVNDLIPLRINNNVYAKSFIGSSIKAEEVKKNDASSLRESVLLNKRDYPLPAEIDVYEDKVAMLSFQQGEFVGLIIQNKDFATSLKSIFKLAFEKTSTVSSTQQDDME